MSRAPYIQFYLLNLLKNSIVVINKTTLINRFYETDGELTFQ
ncbi:hypothetical protein LIBRA_00660 [Leptospira interrogans]